MALAPCVECGHEVSDKAAACPHCGAPIRDNSTPAKTIYVEAPRKSSGCATLIMGVVLLIVVFWVIGSYNSQKRGSRSRPPTTATATSPVPESVRQLAVDHFRSTPVVLNAEWVDGDFTIAVHRNDSSWQPVADGACAWIRRQGAPAGFAVIVLDASALQNKRWDQLARARCN